MMAHFYHLIHIKFHSRKCNLRLITEPNNTIFKMLLCNHQFFLALTFIVLIYSW